MPSERDNASENPLYRLWAVTFATCLLLTVTVAGARFVVTEGWSTITIGITALCGMATLACWLTHFRDLSTASRSTVIRLAIAIAFFAVVHGLNFLQDAGSLLGLWGKDHQGITWADVYLHGVLGATFLGWAIATYQRGKACS